MAVTIRRASDSFANIRVTGGSVAGITDLPVADGGTGASTAAAARTNLGVEASGAAAAHAALTTGIHGVGASTVLSAATAAATYAPISHAMATHSDWPARIKAAYGSANTVGAGGGTIDFAMPDSVGWTYLALVTARKTDGTIGASYILGGGARRSGAGAIDMGAVASQLIVKEDASLAGCNCTEVAAGNAVRLTLTTVAGTDLRWDAILFYLENAGA